MIERECIREALAMIDAFVSVGVKGFGLTRTDINRRRVSYRAGLSVEAMRLSLPHLVPLCWRLSQNLIVRPQEAAGGVLAQLDDLEARQVDRVRSRGFLIVEPSPLNFQVWLAIEGGDKALAQRLMNGIGSDRGASCACRLAGSPNVKPKYAPDFPAVRIVGALGLTVKPGELADLLPSKPVSTAQRHFTVDGNSRGWPDYSKCLNAAPVRADGLPDRSRVDFLWCKWALQRRNAHDAVEVKLLEVSEKARQEWDRGNERYVSRTVEAALRAVC